MNAAQFGKAIQAAGMQPPHSIEPGKLHRFPGIGKSNGNTAGWCKLFDDGLGGCFGDWSSGFSENWQATRDKPFSSAEREEFQRYVAEAKAQAETERKAKQAEAATRAAAIWNAAAPAPDNHPYLVRKNIKASGARQHKDALVIPVRSDGELLSLQFIGSDGEKRFLTSGRKSGGYFTIGKPGESLCIAEGFATGASIHEITGHAVVVAFDAGNLLSIARAMRQKFPDLQLIICADDDLTEGNTGLNKAKEAAQTVGGLLAVPDFGTDRPEGATDFNDLAAQRGKEAVKRAIASAAAPEMLAGNCTPISESLFDAVARLAGLRSLEYEKIRDAEAERLGVRVGALDKEVSIARRAQQADGGKAAMFPTVELWHEPVEGATLLNDLIATIQRFIICEHETAVAAALWCAFTWLVDFVQVAPLAVITAPEKRCGKSQLLSLIGMLSRRPLVASNISPAATFRVIEAHGPTLLIDEADSFFKENEELRGVINSGHTRQSAYVIRTVGDDHEPRQFSTWGAKAISGIGHLAETIMDRAVILELRRKLPSESVQRLRHAPPGLFDEMASKLARFADDAGPSIERARPALPEALNDRAQDNWEPLLAIADYAGGEWPKIARQAALKLSGAEQEATSIGAELLADIHEAFETKRVDRISTAALIASLVDDDEKPWGTYNRGKPISPRQLARKLDGYGIKSKTVRIGYETPKGFDKSQFVEAFHRYLTPSTSATPQQINNDAAFRVADSKTVAATHPQSETAKPAPIVDCGGVADKSGCDAEMEGFEL